MEDMSYGSRNRGKALRERAKRCVCKHCGGQLKLKQLVFSEFEDARVEIFCRSCDRIEFGVEQEVYQSARYFVEQTDFNYYPDLEESERTKKMNIAKVCEIMAWQNEMLGFSDENGFTREIKRPSYMGECIHLTDEDLGELETVMADAPNE